MNSETYAAGPMRALEPCSASWRNISLDIDVAHVKLSVEAIEGGPAEVLITPDQADVLAGRLALAAKEVRASYQAAHRVPMAGPASP